MQTRPLGTSGISVGAIAYGCWRFAGADVKVARERIETALECGMTLIDTADVYGIDDERPWGAAETLLGQVLAEAPELRSQVVIATKGGIHLGPGRGGQPGLGVPYESGRAWLTLACDESLRRLGVEVIDLYQIHRPDLLAHPAEVADTLSALVAQGKVRWIGVSNYTASQLDALRAHLDLPLMTVQPELSVAHLAPLDDGVLDRAMALGLTPLAWSPLAGGALVAEPAATARIAAIQAVLDELAADHGATRTAVALAFLLAHPAGVIPIIGTGAPARIREAATASAVQLSKAECYRLIAAAGRELP